MSLFQPGYRLLAWLNQKSHVWRGRQVPVPLLAWVSERLILASALMANLFVQVLTILPATLAVELEAT